MPRKRPSNLAIYDDDDDDDSEAEEDNDDEVVDDGSARRGVAARGGQQRPLPRSPSPDAELYANRGRDSGTFTVEGKEDASTVEDQLVRGLPNDDPDYQEGEVAEGGAAGAANANDEDSVEDAERLLAIQESKGMIHRTKRGNVKSPAWEFFSAFKLHHNITMDQLKAVDQVAAKTMTEHMAPDPKGNQSSICDACFDDPKIGLADCFKKAKKATGPTNLITHLQRVHPDLYREYLKKVGKTPPAPDPDSASKKKTRKRSFYGPSSQGGGFEARKSSKTSPGHAGLPPRHSSTPGADVCSHSTPVNHFMVNEEFEKVSVDSTLTDLTSSDLPINDVPSLLPLSLQLGLEAVKSQFQKLQHDFVTNHNLAVRVTTERSECPEFHDIVQFCIRNATQLKRAKHLVMGRHQFNAFRVNQYEQFIAGVKMYVLETRDYWSTLLKKRTNFIIICQDV